MSNSGRGAFDVRGLMARVEAWGEGVTESAEAALQHHVRLAAEDYEQEIIDAHTKTGIARAAAGGNGPGRIDTGEMIGDVDWAVYRDGDEIVGEWGFVGPLEDYYLAQEHGHGHTPAIDGLPRTLDRAVDRFGASLDRITGNF